MYHQFRMWSEVELREIRVFLALAEELHFGRTADRLRITPSYASRLIRTLEARVGARLFDRTSRTVHLTPIGQALFSEIEPICEQLQHVLEQTREKAAGVTGWVRIGTYSRGLLHGLREVIDVFEVRHPDCHATYVDTGLERDYLDWLRAGDVDLVVGWLPVTAPGFTVGPIVQRSERVLLVSRDHPLAGRDTVTIEDLANWPVTDAPALNREMMDTFVPPVTPSGRRLRRAARRSWEETLMRVASCEQVHPTIREFLDYYYDPRVVGVPFSDLPPSEAVLVWRTDDRSPAVLAFIQTAADVLAGRGKTRPSIAPAAAKTKQRSGVRRPSPSS